MNAGEMNGSGSAREPAVDHYLPPHRCCLSVQTAAHRYRHRRRTNSLPPASEAKAGQRARSPEFVVERWVRVTKY